MLYSVLSRAKSAFCNSGGTVVSAMVSVWVWNVCYYVVLLRVVRSTPYSTVHSYRGVESVVVDLRKCSRGCYGRVRYGGSEKS